MGKKICVVGAGRWGRNHIRTLHQLGALGGIVDNHPETLAKLTADYPEAAAFDTLDAALHGQVDGRGFDGFIVATPADSHHRIATRILQQKKPVLVEKPLALTARDARELRTLADRQNVPLMVGHVLLFHPAIRKIQELVHGGKIGKLQYLYSNRLNLGTVRTEENILWSFAPHDISIFQALVRDRPIEVVSRGGAFVQPRIHDTTMTVLTYPNNIVGHIFVSWLHPYKEHRLVLIGSKGMLSFEDSSEDKELLFYEKGIDWVQGEPIPRGGPTEVIDYERKMPLTEELLYFLEHLDGERIEIAGGKNGVEVLEILEQATESLRDGDRLHPAAETSTDAAEARRQQEDRQEKNDPFFVHPSSYVDDDVEIGEGTKIWHFSHVQPRTRIGRRCSLGQNVNVGNNVRIGDNVKIQNNVSIYEGVELEDYVFCGPSMVFTNVLDPRCKYPQRGAEHYLRTLVKEGASIGANATIVCGNTVGRHAFIAAGAVVTKDVPDYALIVGVPGCQRGWVCECGEGLPDFTGEDSDIKGIACPRCGLRYAAGVDSLGFEGLVPSPAPDKTTSDEHGA